MQALQDLGSGFKYSNKYFSLPEIIRTEPMSHKDHKVGRFNSNILFPSSLGIDSFCHSWDNEVSWICLLVDLVIHVIRKIKETHGKGVFGCTSVAQGKILAYPVSQG
jgi:hypothetical protein